jgi:hypothetical protein
MTRHLVSDGSINSFLVHTNGAGFYPNSLTRLRIPASNSVTAVCGAAQLAEASSVNQRSAGLIYNTLAEVKGRRNIAIHP